MVRPRMPSIAPPATGAGGSAAGIHQRKRQVVSAVPAAAATAAVARAASSIVVDTEAALLTPTMAKRVRLAVMATIDVPVDHECAQLRGRLSRATGAKTCADGNACIGSLKNFTWADQNDALGCDERGCSFWAHQECAPYIISVAVAVTLLGENRCTHRIRRRASGAY